MFGHVERLFFHGTIHVFVHTWMWACSPLYKGNEGGLCCILPQAVDNSGAAEKVLKRVCIFCGRLYGKGGESAVDWWIVCRGVSAVCLKCCPQGFTRVVHRLFTGFSTREKAGGECKKEALEGRGRLPFKASFCKEKCAGSYSQALNLAFTMRPRRSVQ